MNSTPFNNIFYYFIFSVYFLCQFIQQTTPLETKCKILIVQIDDVPIVQIANVFIVQTRLVTVVVPRWHIP